ncbi:histidine phosphotransferase ChpT [Paracoccus isoporae]|uniref:Histidine phosphotransferase ChpT n=1 Tax=Paracoccus isoporae TaxID=591205 RepID=A0A1G7A2H9_9RHOB|nr:histidine phosphotransferase family protein [Paracoccus isoporae]SDE09032.1 histidine phosphotransferase ChpT [Paracoccus isoporae]
MEYADDGRLAITQHADALTARIVALVGSRICHDLISPLGAIGNGLELLRMAGPAGAVMAGGEEVALVEGATQAARDRVERFRIAFSAAGSTARLTRAETESLIRGFDEAGRLQIEIDIDAEHPRGIVKLGALSLMCLQSALPWGGRVQIRQNGRGWALHASADRLRRDPALWGWLAPDRGDLPLPPASEVHFPLLALSAQEMGHALDCDIRENAARIAF